MGIEVRDQEEHNAFARELDRCGFTAQDLTDNDLAKTHSRYMVEGRSNSANQKVLYRF